jgi:hypothetical protein
MRTSFHFPRIALSETRTSPRAKTRKSPPAGVLTAALSRVDFRGGQVRGGHSRTTVRVRLGQGAFRRRLLAEYGPICALTGPAPATTLEAAHLYSYAREGAHHDRGGLLLRRDVHRFFDLGQIAVEPASLRIDVEADLRRYDVYARLHGRDVRAAITPGHREWLRQHWHSTVPGWNRAPPDTTLGTPAVPPLKGSLRSVTAKALHMEGFRE